MKKPTIKLLLLVTGVIIYDLLFWQSYWGINTLIFTLLLIGYLFSLEPEARKNRNILITAAGTLAAAILVVTHNSLTSMVALLVSLIVLTGFYYQTQLRSVVGAIPTGFLNFLFAPLSAIMQARQFSGISVKTKPAWNILKLSIIPVFVCFIFFLIYKAANPVFDKLSTDFLYRIGDYIEDFFENFSAERVLFIMLGIVIVTGVLVNSNIRRFMLWDNRSQDALEYNPVENQQNTTGDEGYVSEPLFTIQDGFKMGIILLVLINLLLFVVNGIDINWLWRKVEFSTDLNLSQLVHEGTYLLIFSILLSIAIMLFLFRGALNYNLNAPWLRYLAYLWIAQNVVMVISVAIRNYHYIHYFGLAYKRIGVLVFLALTVFGLIALAIKISRKRSFYFLVRTFGWAVYAMLISISLINWDLIIARHNTTHQFPENMDLRFLLSLSDKSLHIIAQNDAILDRYAAESRYSYFRAMFNQRVNTFMQRMETTKWQEWNYPEQVTYKYFIENKHDYNEQSN